MAAVGPASRVALFEPRVGVFGLLMGSIWCRVLGQVREVVGAATGDYTSPHGSHL